MSDEIDPVEEVRAVEHARTVGESFMRERLQADSNRRVTMRTQILEPENAFTPEERRILAGPPPPYSREDRDADEQFEKYKCPISQDYPDLPDIVVWRNNYYNIHSLRELRLVPSNFRDPLTGETLSYNEFTSGERHLSLPEKQEFIRQQASYNNRSSRRDARRRYDALRARRTALYRTSAQVDVARDEGLPVGQAPSIEEQLNDIGHNDLVWLGIDQAREARDQQRALARITNPQDYAAAATRVNNLLRRTQRTQPTGPVRVAQATLAQATNAIANQASQQANQVTRRANQANRQANQATNHPNPLEQQPQQNLTVFPTNPWGNPTVENAVNEWLHLLRNEGWENTVHRNRLAYFHANHERFFRQGGPFFGFRGVNGQGLSRRWTRLENHTRQLILNHNNDPTGEQGEERPIWFPIMQEFFQWRESQATQNQNQQNHRANMRNVQQELGIVQAPLGPGNPPLRSEIAAENDPQVPGPQELAANIEIAVVAQQQPVQASTQQDAGQPTRGTGRRRSNSPAPGGTTRSNRRRVDGPTIQDDIQEGRNNLSRVLGSIETMAQAIVPANAPAPRPRPFVDDPIGTLRSIQENMLAIANNLGPSEVREANVRMYHSWHGILGNLAQANNMNIPEAPSLPTDTQTGTSSSAINNRLTQDDEIETEVDTEDDMSFP